MGHRVLSAFAGFIVGLVMISAEAQTVNLTGTVIDSATQKGIKGATVKLVGLKDSTVTDTNGYYMLTNSSVKFFGPLGSQAVMAPHFSQNSLVFGVSAGQAHVRAEIFSLTGRRIVLLIDNDLAKGLYRLNPYVSMLSDQLFFLKIRIGDHTTLLKMPLTHHANGLSVAKFNDVGTGGGSAKRTMINDTIKIIADGYVASSKPITSFVGMNNFSLARADQGGTISFENASYQGCVFPAFITVEDHSPQGSSISVHVRSTSDPLGFSFALRPVIGSPGLYADSLYFSIKKSDSIKHLIKVSDLDSIFAAYDHGVSGTAIRTTTTVWSGSVGQVGPGASQYFGLRSKMAISLFDPDISDSTATVTVKSPKDTIGFPLTLYSLAGNPGVFNRNMGFTLGASVADSLLSVDGSDSLGQLITLIYHDATPMGTIYGSICTWIPAIGSLVLDSTVYHGTASMMGISLVDADILDGIVVVSVKSKKDSMGILDTLQADTLLQGSFTSRIGFSTVASSPRTIRVSDGDTVSVIYHDNTPVKIVTDKVIWKAQ